MTIDLLFIQPNIICRANFLLATPIKLRRDLAQSGQCWEFNLDGAQFYQIYERFKSVNFFFLVKALKRIYTTFINYSLYHVTDAVIGWPSMGMIWSRGTCPFLCKYTITQLKNDSKPISHVPQTTT